MSLVQVELQCLVIIYILDELKMLMLLWSLLKSYFELKMIMEISLDLLRKRWQYHINGFPSIGNYSDMSSLLIFV